CFLGRFLGSRGCRCCTWRRLGRLGRLLHRRRGRRILLELAPRGIAFLAHELAGGLLRYGVLPAKRLLAVHAMGDRVAAAGLLLQQARFYGTGFHLSPLKGDLEVAQRVEAERPSRVDYYCRIRRLHDCRALQLVAYEEIVT